MRKLWETWKRIGQFIGDWIARIVLTLFYFSIFAPFGLGVRLFGDPLGIRNPAGDSYQSWPNKEPTLKNARRLS